MWGYSKKDSEARTRELLELVGLTEAGDRRVKTYSGGMKRRLDLGLSLVHSPEILFLDEPTTGLDPGSRRVSSVSANKPTLDDVFLEVTGYRLEGSEDSQPLEVKGVS